MTGRYRATLCATADLGERPNRQVSEEVSSLAASLRGLADALDAFNNYRPGTFFDSDEVQDTGAHGQTGPDR
ncbi:MAG: hypothetical protein ACRD0Q_03025 [Acidimicrobiales bacterium]